MSVGFEQLPAALAGAANPVREQRQAGEAYLREAQTKPGFAVALLQLVKQSEADVTLEGDVDFIPASDRQVVKANVLELMITVPVIVKRQLSDTVGHIARHDFPESWPTLASDITARLSTSDMAVMQGMLETANAMCRRFRIAEDTDTLRLALLAAIDGLAEPLTKLIQQLIAALDAHAQDAAMLEKVLTCIRLVLRVFYSLNSVDLPAYFEDNIQLWMRIHAQLLAYKSPVLADLDETEQAGPLDRVQAAVLENLVLYVQRYDEEFEPFFKDFVQATWPLLSAGGHMSQPRYDAIMTQGVKFLNVAASRTMHEGLFAEQSVLVSLITKVAVPNMMLREADEEMVEDNPREWALRDMEGSDMDTRRRAAADLVRQLTRRFEDKVTAICLQHAQSLLEATGEANWRSREVGLVLLGAVTAKAVTRMSGATEVNAAVPVLGLLQQHVLPLLTGAPGPGSSDMQTGDIILRGTAMKLLTVFRSQLGASDTVLQALDVVTPWLASPVWLLHTYAAICVERMAAMASLTQEGMAARATAVLGPMLQLLGRADYGENEYLLRAVMRVVGKSGAAIAPHAGQLLTALSSLVMRVAANPSNPQFNHFIFESLALLIRGACQQQPAQIAAAEGALMPVFTTLLESDVREFVPYVYQLLAALLWAQPQPAPGSHALSQAYMDFLPRVLQPAMWSTRANVPALASLLTAYTARGAQFIVQSGKLQPLLGVFQKLLSAATTEDYAFALLNAAVRFVPAEALKPLLPTVATLVLTRMQHRRALPLARHFIIWFSLTAWHLGGADAASVLNGVQAGLFLQLCEQVLAANANKVLSAPRRRVVAGGISKLVLEAPDFWSAGAQGAQLWAKMIQAGLTVAEGDSDATLTKEQIDAAAEEQRLIDERAAEVAHEYSAQYAKLSYVAPAQENKSDYLAGVNVRQQWATTLASIVSSRGAAVLKSAMASMSAPVAETVRALSTAAGVSLA